VDLQEGRLNFIKKISWVLLLRVFAVFGLVYGVSLWFNRAPETYRADSSQKPLKSDGSLLDRSPGERNSTPTTDPDSLIPFDEERQSKSAKLEAFIQRRATAESEVTEFLQTATDEEVLGYCEQLLSENRIKLHGVGWALADDIVGSRWEILEETLEIFSKDLSRYNNFSRFAGGAIARHRTVDEALDFFGALEGHQRFISQAAIAIGLAISKGEDFETRIGELNASLEKAGLSVERDDLIVAGAYVGLSERYPRYSVEQLATIDSSNDQLGEATTMAVNNLVNQDPDSAFDLFQELSSTADSPQRFNRGFLYAYLRSLMVADTQKTFQLLLGRPIKTPGRDKLIGTFLESLNPSSVSRSDAELLFDQISDKSIRDGVRTSLKQTYDRFEEKS